MNVTSTPDGTLVYTTPHGVAYIASGHNANCTLPQCPVQLSVYGYRASLPLSTLLITLYFLCAVTQAYLGWRYKTWSYMAAMILGCASEILGYAGRIMMWQNPWARPGFIMQIGEYPLYVERSNEANGRKVLITIAPVFFSAAIYVMLYQIVTYISVRAARFPPKLFYWIFIPCDIMSLVLQAAGGAMSASSNGDSSAGVNIALAGLVLQVFTLVLFIVAVVDYAILSRYVWHSTKFPLKFKVFCVFLGLATIIILTRCCYRVYELSGGYSRDSGALRDQPLFIGLEGVMVIVAAWCLVVSHPGPVFQTNKDSAGTANGRSEGSSHKSEA